MEAPANFRDFLDDWRLSKGWSIQRVADEVGVHQSLVSKWLHPDARRRVVPGRPRLKRIAEITGVPYSQIRELAELNEDNTTEEAAEAAGAVVQSELDARLARLAATLGKYPRAFWLAVVEASERMAAAGDAFQGGGVSAPDQDGVSSPSDVRTQPQRASNDPLANISRRPELAPSFG